MRVAARNESSIALCVDQVASRTLNWTIEKREREIKVWRAKG
jgi:hypothetical protein